ncbi:pelle-like serine/threonine-protein kinase pik-1, partial [Nasonia vitripennis]|uniref:non-specific serine/threonine protein kinase n=1 Tax=Nasonia vitripennis TaxID=7425 RepID=A0A7M7R2Y7_NASVI
LLLKIGFWKNTEVAIKKIKPRGSDYDESYALQLEQSFREIKILNSSPHENILPLYAYSIGGEAPCLVYQYMKNGSLEDRLHLKHGSNPLNWIQRLEIAKGIARGLQYLHTIRDKPLIHGDIKSANILLDKNFEPKIGDFGLAREGSPDDSLKVSKIQGTRPYLPEEYIFKGTLSTKIDTYSYGIVLFELATGLSAYDKSRPTNKKLKEYVDSFQDKDLHLFMDKKAGDKYYAANTFMFDHEDEKFYSLSEKDNVLSKIQSVILEEQAINMSKKYIKDKYKSLRDNFVKTDKLVEAKKDVTYLQKLNLNLRMKSRGIFNLLRLVQKLLLKNLKHIV